ncbi:MAG: sugar ABC transporter substrate-binding protein [Lacrimispora sp.]|uniref:sugar ABC transporter substrate-binding protein n=1 Tax=Lacrimispora sp. TaxID=2719234 RepID=UPI0039E54889
MKKGKLVLAGMCMALALGMMTGCSQAQKSESAQTSAEKAADGAGENKDSSDGKVVIGVSTKTNTNPFNIEVADAISKAVKEGDEVIFTDAQQNQAKQINDVEDLIQQGCNVILIAPVDWQGTRGMLEACQRAGVHAIIIDQNIPEEDAKIASAVVCSDNYNAGKLCAEDLVKKLDGKGEIVIYESSISKAGLDRVSGFEDYIADYPEIKVVNRQDGLGQIEASLPVMENMLQANPDIAGVFAFNDPAAIGCIAAIESANKIGDILVYGVDGSEQGRKMVVDKKLEGTAAQFPSEIGKQAVETAYKLMNGEIVEKLNLIPVKFINIENVNQ